MAESNKRRPLLTKATKGPLIWIVMALLVVSIGALLFSRVGFSQIDTEQRLKLLADDKVEQVKIVDRDQRVDLTLKDDLKIDGQDFGNKVQFYYVEQ
ncbi:cell division protein FtsH, partial [Burkholderia multivorans]